MSESEALFSVLRQSADPACVAAIEQTVRDAPDRELCRINVLDFAAKHGLDEERALAAFLHAARLGLFELSWNVLCPGCGGVLDAGATLKTIDHEEYACGLCASGYKPTLDEMVEVTFTVSPRAAPHRRPRSRHAARDRILPADFLEFWRRFARDIGRQSCRIHHQLDRIAARRKGGAVGTIAERFRHRIRSGDPRHAVHQRQTT